MERASDSSQRARRKRRERGEKWRERGVAEDGESASRTKALGGREGEWVGPRVASLVRQDEMKRDT